MRDPLQSQHRAGAGASCASPDHARLCAPGCSLPPLRMLALLRLTPLRLMMRSRRRSATPLRVCTLLPFQPTLCTPDTS